MFVRGFEGWHLLIILGLLVVLFGARRLPDSARAIGRSLRILKSELTEGAENPRPPAESAEPVDSGGSHSGGSDSRAAEDRDTADHDTRV